MPNLPPDRRLEYWRHVARAAEQDLHHLRDGILEAADNATTLGELVAELVRLASQPSDRHHRAQDAYNKVNEHTSQEKS